MGDNETVDLGLSRRGVVAMVLGVVALLLFLIALVAAVTIYVVRMSAPPPMPAGGGVRPAAVVTLVDVFATNPNRAEAKQHAADAEALFRALGELIEVDGKFGASVRLKTNADVEDVRVVMVSLFGQGWSFGRVYPSFGNAVSRHLATVGDSAAAPLDDVMRRKWCAACEAIATECRLAKEGL